MDTVGTASVPPPEVHWVAMGAGKLGGPHQTATHWNKFSQVAFQGLREDQSEFIVSVRQELWINWAAFKPTETASPARHVNGGSRPSARLRVVCAITSPPSCSPLPTCAWRPGGTA